MRMRSWILPLVLAVPLLWFGTDADSCIRFKKPGGSVPPGLREPTDPPPPEGGETPTTGGNPAPATTPGASMPTGPVTGGPAPTGPTVGGAPGANRKQAAQDDSTWETWWELNRIDFFPRRWVRGAVTPDESGLVRAGPEALSPKVVATKLWPVLVKGVNDPQVFVQEASLITMGRVAANEKQRAEARRVLTEKLSHRNHLIARAAALGLFYVANEESILPMYEAAKNEKTEEDVRAFLALTMTNLKHPMAAQLLRDLADTKKGYYELVGAAIMGLGYTGVANDPWIPEFLEEIAFKKKKVRSEYRALAVESFGRIGDLQLGAAPLLRGLVDRDTNVRRSAAIGLGVLDYRTDAERQIEEIKAPYEEFLGVPMSPEDEARIQALEALVPDQRLALTKQVKGIVKKLGVQLQQDGDAFVRRMCAVSLGRIQAQSPQPLAVRMLEEALKKDRIGMREFALLGLAIGNAPTAPAHALKMIEERNPSTRGAACIALGLVANKDRAHPVEKDVREQASARLQKILLDDAHPFIRGYACIALGILGDSSAAKLIKHTTRSTATPETRAYGSLGLALLGTREGADDLVAILSSKLMRNGFVASHAVYSLGLTKDRRPSTYDSLIEKALDRGDMYVQAATVAAIGYVSSSEFYPRRHLMATGYNYLLGLDYIETYFYKL